MGRSKSKGRAKEGQQGDGDAAQQQRVEYQQPADPPRAALAVHPQGAAVAVAVGAELRVYDTKCAADGQMLHAASRLMHRMPPPPAQALPPPPPLSTPPLPAPLLPIRRAQQLRVLVSKPEPGQQQQQQGKGQQAAAAAPIIRGVAFDVSGRYLLAGSEDKAAGIRLWDCATWELLQSM